MIKIDVFNTIDDVLHIGSFEQLFHRRDSTIIMTNVIKSSTFEHKMLYSERTFTM